MENKIVKIKIEKGAPELEGKTLSLVRTKEGHYICQKSGIEIVDAWGEIELLEEYSKKYRSNSFFDMQLFSTSFGNDLKFIDEIELVDVETIKT